MTEEVLRKAPGRWHDEFPRGAIVFWPPGSPKQDRFRVFANACCHIDLAAPLYERVRHLFPVKPATALGAELFEGAIRTMVREIQASDAAAPLALEGVVYTVIARASRILNARDAHSAGVNRALDFIHRRFKLPIRLAEIGEAAKMSERRLAERFRKELGISPAEYVRRTRLDAAAKKLATSDASIGEIALACGFYDQAHLTRQFRRRFKTTPRTYRNRHRSR